MRLKTYLVDNISEAMPLIKKDLGIDALILNTKKVRTGGFLGLFQKEKLEVIAAIENKPKQKEEKFESLVPEMLEEKLEKPQVSKVNEQVTNELMDELKTLKKFMVQVIEDDRLPESLKGLNKQLLRQDVTTEVLSELISKLMVVVGQNPDLNEEQTYTLARHEIISLIKSHQPQIKMKQPDIICFVGPTGVGKTTTIAKIAADYLLNANKKVGLITSDTYRIAAVEQLRTYATILGIPFKVVQSPEELQTAINELQDCDMILMDTAGRNYQQKEYIDELEELLIDKAKVQINLVLSLTSKFQDMKKIIANFNSINIDELLLTKKDETSSYGAIINLIYEYSTPIRYITVGQSVPDDILTVTPELIADFLLGEDRND